MAYSTAILVYDSLLTLDSEIEHIWLTGRKQGSAWFIFIRFCALCGNIVMFVLMFGDFAFEVSESLFFLQTVTDSAQT